MKNFEEINRTFTVKTNQFVNRTFTVKKNSILQGLRLDQKVSKVLRAAYETVTGRLRDDKPRNMSGARVAQEWLKYAAMFVMLFSLGVGNAWGTYTITFNGSNSDSTPITTSTTAASITGSSSYVTGDVVTATKVYGATSDGIKLGASSNAGTIKINLSTSGQVTPTSIVVNCKLYNSGKPATLQVNGSTTQSVPSSSGDLTFSITSPITYIELVSSKYIWVKSVKVNTGSSCGVPTSPSNGAKTATTQPVSWTAPGSAPANGYVVAVCATNTTPNTNVTIMNGNAYWSGDYYYAHIAAGTRNYTFSTTSGAYLTAGTTYYWWVRSKCGTSDYSAWVAGTAFTIPNIAVSTDEIDDLDYEFGNGPTNPAKTFTVSGTGLTGNLTVALDGGSSSDFEISKTSATTGYNYTLSLTQTSGSVGTTTIWVRLKSGKSVDTYVDNITISGGTATAKEVIIGGEVTTVSCTDGTVSYAAGSVPSGGGSITGSHASDTKVCSTNLTLPGVVFTTTGYTQTGWATSDGGSQAYALSATTYATEGDATLYPVWTANTYTVTWSVNGNTSTITATTGVTYNTTTTAPNVTPTGDCAELVFRGWTTAAIVGTQNSEPDPLFTGTTPAITGDVTFYAVFAEED